MAKRIGTLAAVVTANSAGFTRGLKTARGAVQQFATTARTSLGGAAQYAGARLASIATAATIATTAAAAAMTVLVKHSFEDIDKLAKTADTIGITTEALGGLRYAADLAGVGAEQLDKALFKMTKTIASAAEGDRGAGEIFDKIGLSAARLAQQRPENQIKAIADAINAMPSPTDRAAAAMDIFGSRAARIMNLLKEGGSGIGKLSDEADRLGMTVSRIDAAKVEMANDAMTTLWATIKGTSNAVAVQLAPYITAAARTFTELGINGKTAASFITGAIKGAVLAVAYLSEVVTLGQVAWAGLQFAAAKAIQGILYPVEQLAQTVLGLTQMFGEYLPESMTAAAAGFATSISQMRSDLESFAASQAGKIDDILTAPSAVDSVKRWFAEAEQAANEEAAAMAKAADEKLAKQEEYNDSLLKGLQLAEDETNVAEKAAKKKKKAAGTQEEVKLIVADKGASENFVLQAQIAQQRTIQDQMLAEAEEQTDQLKDIADNTEDLADDEAVAVFL